jgi:hypothetical protein
VGKCRHWNCHSPRLNHRKLQGTYRMATISARISTRFAQDVARPMNCAEDDAVVSMLQTDGGGAAASTCTTPTRPKTRKATPAVVRTLLFAKGNGVARTSPSTTGGRACPNREKPKAHSSVVVVAGVVLRLQMGASDFKTNVFVLALVVGVNTPHSPCSHSAKQYRSTSATRWLMVG